MKHFILSAAFSIMFLFPHAQNPNWLWAKTLSGGNTDLAASDINTDANGNSYVIGSYNSGSMNLEGIILTNTVYNWYDVFIARYNSSGTPVWAKSFGGTKHDYGINLVVDNNGNIYCSGYFSNDTINFGATTLYGGGGQYVFVAKYDTAGNFIWAKRLGTGSYNTPDALEVTGDGSILLSMRFQGTTTTVGDSVYTNYSGGGTSDVVFVKMDANGNITWNKRIGGNKNDRFDALRSLPGGDIIAGGYFASDTFLIDTVKIGNLKTNLPSQLDDYLVMKLDVDGNYIWSQNGATPKSDALYDLDVDNSGNIYATGVFYDTIFYFGNDTLHNPNPNYQDLFIAKFDNNGNKMWAKNINSPGAESGYAIDVDSHGNPYVLVQFNEDSVFFNGQLITGDSSLSMFDAGVFKLSPDGDLLWYKLVSGQRNDFGQASAFDDNDNYYFVGTFDSYTLKMDNFSFSNNINFDMVIGKLGFSATGIREPASPNSILIFPNPASHQIIFDLSKSGNSDGELIVTDIVGRTVLMQQINSSIKANVESWSSGIYTATLQFANGGQLKSKFMVEK